MGEMEKRSSRECEGPSKLWKRCTSVMSSHLPINDARDRSMHKGVSPRTTLIADYSHARIAPGISKRPLLNSPTARWCVDLLLSDPRRPQDEKNKQAPVLFR